MGKKNQLDGKLEQPRQNRQESGGIAERRRREHAHSFAHVLEKLGDDERAERGQEEDDLTFGLRWNRQHFGFGGVSHKGVVARGGRIRIAPMPRRRERDRHRSRCDLDEAIEDGPLVDQRIHEDQRLCSAIRNAPDLPRPVGSLCPGGMGRGPAPQSGPELDHFHGR